MALDSKTHNVYLSIADFEACSRRTAGDKAQQRPKVVPGTFGLLEYGR